jgi:hypothetical protein
MHFVRRYLATVAPLFAILGCSGSSSSPSSKALTVTATPVTVAADGVSTVAIHVEGGTKSPVTLVTSRGHWDNGTTAMTLDGTSSDVTLHSCNAAQLAACAGSTVVQAVDANLVAGAATVVFTSSGTSSGPPPAGGGTDGGSGGTGGTDGGTAPVYALSLVASSTRIPADGNAAAVITAAVTADGKPAAGRSVTFSQSGTAATLTTPAATDSNGATSVTLKSVQAGGTAVVTATDTASGQKATLSIEMPQLGQLKVIAQDFQVQGVRSSGYQEVNQVTFELRDTVGKTYPAGLNVDFSHQSLLDSFVGTVPNCGTGFPTNACTAAGVTDDHGQVTVSLTSGTAAGPVSVKATAKAGNATASAIASNIAIVGAKASGAHITIDCTPKNIPALSDNDCSYSHYAGPGSNVTCTATFADRFNNTLGVPTLTTFLSEAGNASAPSLTNSGVATGAIVVTGGRLPDNDLLTLTTFQNEPTAPAPDRCGVTGTPRRGLVTVIAMAVGEEGFVDLNGNGVHDANEPFIDIGEPYVDVNDNGRWDPGEPFVDVNHNGTYDGPNGQWDSNTVIWAETRILYTDQPAFASLGAETPPLVALALDATESLKAVFRDENMNPLAASTTYAVSAAKSDVASAAITSAPSNLDGLGIGFTQQYCDRQPGDPGTANCSSSCSFPKCYVVTNVGDCNLKALSDRTKRAACNGFSAGSIATADVKGTCSATGSSDVVASATLNGLVTKVKTNVTCTVPPPPPVYAITLDAAPMSILATGEAVTISALVTQDGKPVQGRSVSFSSVAGTVTPISPTTDASGVATARFTSNASGGSVTITAVDDASAKVAQITVSLPTYAVALSAPPMTATATGQTVTVAAVLTANGQAVAGRAISFATPGAQVTILNGTTDANGVARATVASTGPAGSLSVTATDDTSGQSGRLALVAPAYAVAASTSAMVAGPSGGTATVTATVTADGRPVPGRAVTFAAPGAQLTGVSATTNASGVAIATITSAASGGNVTVVVTDVASGQLGKATAALPVYAVALSTPKMIPNATGQAATVTATVTADGLPLAGRAVQFAAPGATVTVVSGTTDASGVASATIASTAPGGTVVVSATDAASGQVATSTLVMPVYAVAVTATMTATASGQTATFTAVVTADGLPVASRPVDFAASRGALAVVVGTTDVSGVAKATVTSASLGDITVTATDHVSGKSDQATIATPAYAIALTSASVVATDTGQTATLHATLTANGQPVQGRDLQFTSTSAGGTLTPTHDLTTAGGLATVQFVSSDVGGQITFTAMDPVSGAFGVLSVAMPVYALTVTSSTVLPTATGQTATITATFTADGQPVRGRTVTLSATGGSFSAMSGPTNASGVTTATFSTSAPDTVTVTATEAVSTKAVQVDVVMPVYAVAVQATAVVPSATSATSSISATLTADGHPVPGRVVSFSSSDAQVIPNDTTTAAGVASATFSSAASGGNATVTASDGVSKQTGQVTVALPVYAVTVTASPSTIDGSGNVTTPLLATLTANGQPLAGRALAFAPAAKVAADAGQTVTNASGVMTATLTQAPTDGSAVVTVTEGVSGQKGSVAVAAAPRLGNITVASQQYGVQGVKNSGYQETSAITFQVSDSAGNPYVAGLRVDFSHVSIAGSSISPAFATTDASGQVSVSLRSGTAAANASVVATASAGGATVSATAKALFVGALPNASHVSVDCTPKNVPAFLQNDCLYSYYSGPGSQVTCTATLADVYGNTIAIPLNASFMTEAGKISAQATTDAAGVATAKLDVYGGTLPKDVGSGAPGDPLYAGEPNLVFDDTCGTARVHNPRDGLVTVIAMVRGQQGFIDVNGNGVYDGPNSPNLQDPKYAAYKTAGEPYVDQGEPFVDYNDNGVRDDDEPYVDVNGNGHYDPPGTDGAYKNDTVIWAETRIVYTGEPNPNAFQFAPATPFALFADPNDGSTTDLRPVLVGDGNLNQVSSVDLTNLGVKWSVNAPTASAPAVTASLDASADMTAKTATQLPISFDQVYCSIADSSQCSSQCTVALSPCLPKTHLGFYAPEALPRVGVKCNSVQAGLTVTVTGLSSSVPVSATLAGACQ